ncbi:transcriptional regulator, TetR family [Myxococcus xanthus DK 1622]|uniref:Transcriptional regulator, TetR family n=1 Tax=Myxococcus xanthus (strain DK1622) TaxID=246197 RepID=Q1D1G7_MYXXD|nr:MULTISPECIES: TetR family transcriptional regulator [Myxococcus]ABF90393.1 transcriptional regulator, TetR family [Myxococcus xanthus DK 1622]NOJ54750.1 TetR family transcriptional regulator [Myxococcus xanthus]QPM77825.1 TetR family transcriptional regulator [Myxococcus xanthus]QVW66893.1 TetR family transcriptional regulator [Myxococcus xanthus DZ2]QZZ53012.1 HTH-type transcriptional regulator BetI [Myxococcus xanthus]
MPRPSNTEERRQQIVAGLLKVMSERGYERASVSEIAKAAGLSAGLVHYHFSGKQEILLTLVEQLAAQARQRVATRLERVKSPDARARVDAFVEAFLATGDDAAPAAVASWVTISAEAIRQPEVRAIYEQVVRADLEHLTSLVAAVVGRRKAPALAAGLFAAVQGYFVLAASVPGLVPAGSAASTVKRMAAGLLDPAGAKEDA